MVVDDIANIPPKKRQSIRLQAKSVPTLTPRKIIQKIIVHAAIIADPPTLTIFLKLNSRPKANNRNITPISAHKCTFSLSTTDGV